MFLIIGLGNPGPEYEHTFHNLGRMSAIKLQKELGIRDFVMNGKFQSLLTEGKIGKERIAIALPETFMKREVRILPFRGEYYKIKPAGIVVIHDDADIKLGSIKIVRGKNSGGHKGVESVMRALKTKDFIRIRIGTTKSISKKGIWRDRDLMEKVVKKIPASQKLLVQKGIKLAVAAVKMTIGEGLGKAMSMYNRNA